MALTLASVAVAAGLFVGQAAPAQARAVCTDARSTEAMTALAKLPADKPDDWKSLHGFYARFADCDDGGPSEDITEKVVKLLAHRWSSLVRLDKEATADPRFAAFVLRHVDSTADTDDLTEIKRTATHLCPPKLTRLCTRIKAAASGALDS